MLLIQANKILINSTIGKGRGLIASENIASGELIERAPIIEFDEEQTKILLDQKIDAYLWAWNSGDNITKTGVALGMISLCNHSRTPNCRIEKHYEKQMIELIAAREIKIGEELTLQYISTDFED
ncbi:MAG: SET domain-containing protein-lysine N-methyltransferase [Methylococcaceae bacterium]